jgi:hypothetical protein
MRPIDRRFFERSLKERRPTVATVFFPRPSHNVTPTSQKDYAQVATAPSIWTHTIVYIAMPRGAPNPGVQAEKLQEL